MKKLTVQQRINHLKKIIREDRLTTGEFERKVKGTTKFCIVGALSVVNMGWWKLEEELHFPYWFKARLISINDRYRKPERAKFGNRLADMLPGFNSITKQQWADVEEKYKCMKPHQILDLIQTKIDYHKHG